MIPGPLVYVNIPASEHLMINPLSLFLLLFVAAPLIELYVLIEVGSQIGALSTILLSIFTAVLGATLVRLQGFSVLFRAQSMMSQGEAPAIEMMEGAVLLVVGLALLLPGFITDAVGFLLLITPVRRAVIIWMLKSRGVMRPAGPAQRPGQTGQHQDYLEGDYHRED